VIAFGVLAEDDGGWHLVVVQIVTQVIAVIVGFVCTSFLVGGCISRGFCVFDSSPMLPVEIASLLDACLSEALFGVMALVLSSGVLSVWDNFVVRLAKALSKAAL